jgi:hypothetical protein
VANRFQHSTASISKVIANVAESIVALNDIEAFSDEELLKPSEKLPRIHNFSVLQTCNGRS